MPKAKKQPKEMPTIAIDEAFRATARQAFRAWNIVSVEELSDQGIEGLRVKFKKPESANVFARSMLAVNQAEQAYFHKINPLPTHGPELKSTTANKETPLSVCSKAGGGDTRWVGLTVSSFLPRDFFDLANDIARADKNLIEVQPELFSFAEAYLAAFDGSFELADLDFSEDTNSRTVEKHGDDVRKAQKLLRHFLTMFIKARDSHVIVIKPEFVYEIDGQTAPIKGAAERAVLVLALLQKNTSFSVNEFAEIYTGKKSDDAKSDFDNAMRPVKNLLPKIRWDSDVGNRSILNINLQVEPTDGEIRARLKLLTRKK